MTDLTGVLRDAHTFYRSPRVLDPSWVPAHLNSRNLYPQLRPAGIGYAPPGWTAVTDHLRGRGHTDSAIEAAGLARTASTGNLVDLFRDRLMIPVADADRRLVGFLGRASEAAGPDTPKYLNSPAGDLFNKSRLLYALGEDRAGVASGAMPILVEGPMDRLAIRQAAQHLNVVGLAPCGTALTAQQAQQLIDVIGPRRPVAVAFDADPAGQNAAVRAWDRLTAAGLTNLLHVTLPPGKDPADLIRGGRGQQLRHAIVAARPLAVAVADHKIAAAGNLDHLQKRVAILEHLLTHDLPHVPADRVGPYLTHLGHRLNLDHHDVTLAAAEHLSPSSAHAPDVAEAFTAQTLTAEGFPENDSSPTPLPPDLRLDDNRQRNVEFGHTR